ncbi:MAG TPA: signal peptide peptidase SppA [Verrucomicrobiae bacterium]|nr:signal peptide peptidase SppA [Verrucomicrobiae bacterium]
MTWGKRRAIIILTLVLVFAGLIWWGISLPTRISSRSVLLMDVNGQIEEQRPEDILSAFSGGSIPVQHDYTDAIDAAATDPKIAGLLVRIGPLETGWAKLEEIHSHLLNFRKSGKPSVCYLGYDGIGNAEYYLATGCAYTWIVPTAPVNIHGMMAQALFFRGTLDKLKIVPEFYHIAEFKTATNMFTEKKFTAPHHEEVEGLLDGIYGQFLTEAAQARGLDRTKFQALVEQGPLSTSDAIAGNLVDREAYWDQVQNFFRQRTGEWNPVTLNRYVGSIHESLTGDQIAVVHATGLIVSGDSGNTPGGGFVMGGDTVAKDIRTARNDSSIRAIVLRIDSGGGSALASEVIRREVALARGVKPVVVSMSDVAASGGYWIAMGADKIVAEPDTITASIGVLAGKFNVSGLYNLLGVSTDSVITSENATFYSDQQNFTPTQQASIMKMLNQTYANFTKGVASGRHLPLEEVDRIGKGRVWTGAQAKDLKLVDELGGLDTAIAAAKQLAHIPESEEVRIINFPKQKTFFELLMDRQRDQMSEARTLDETLERLVGTMEPIQARMPFNLRIQ